MVRLRVFSVGIQSVLLFAGMLAVTEFVGIPWLLGEVPEQYVPWDRVYARRLEMRKEQHYDVLALGDSTGVQSLIPEHFSSLTGKAMFNYGTYSDRGALTDIYFLLEYLKKHGTPEAIITVRSPYSWHEFETIDAFYRQFPHLGLSWRLYERGLMTFPQVLRMGLETILPSIFYRHRAAEIRQLIGDKQLRGEHMLNRKEIPGVLGYEHFDTERHRAHPSMDEQNWQVFRQMVDENGNARIHPNQIVLLQLLCDVASENGVHMYVTTGPYHDVFKSDPEVSPVFVQIEDAIEHALKGRGMCHYWRENRVFAEEYLSDPTHTLHEGSLFFTEQIAGNYLQRK